MTETATTGGQVLHPSCFNRFGFGKGFSIAIEHFRSRWSRPGVSMSPHSIFVSLQNLVLDRVFMPRQSVRTSRQSLA